MFLIKRHALTNMALLRMILSSEVFCFEYILIFKNVFPSGNSRQCFASEKTYIIDILFSPTHVYKWIHHVIDYLFLFYNLDSRDLGSLYSFFFFN